VALELQGVLTALITPFTPHGDIDEQALRQVVDRSIDGGVDGVVACGSSGEFAALTHKERRFVVETVVDQAAGRVPVVAQTGAISTAEAIELTRHAEEAGAAVAMVITPYYEPLADEETIEYLRAVAASVDIPIMIYNYPAATGVNLSPELVGRLAGEITNIRYIKDTSGDIDQARLLIHHYADVISTFIGWDTLALEALTEGAAGIMVGTANVIPAQLASIRQAILAGDTQRAGKEWQDVYPLVEAIASAPFAAAVKVSLERLGLPVGSVRKPLLGLNRPAAARITDLVTAL
jgi:4-hydroxy-tetrahydrodipicolinate synthase